MILEEEAVIDSFCRHCQYLHSDWGRLWQFPWIWDPGIINVAELMSAAHIHSVLHLLLIHLVRTCSIPTPYHNRSWSSSSTEPIELRLWVYKADNFKVDQPKLLKQKLLCLPPGAWTCVACCGQLSSRTVANTVECIRRLCITLFIPPSSSFSKTHIW